ncbi:Hypothetical_protein [Hexamita inflata]|uniref:Hypothetical_protein n=1 Tax=Hexamita inflata TaxID=28002 RepID=A0AA86PBP4_9EUKA|nr:Hypothetical protein HINF_LOCUS23629 [Hexamita inflata]
MLVTINFYKYTIIINYVYQLLYLYIRETHVSKRLVTVQFLKSILAGKHKLQFKFSYQNNVDRIQISLDLITHRLSVCNRIFSHSETNRNLGSSPLKQKIPFLRLQSGKLAKIAVSPLTSSKSNSLCFAKWQTFLNSFTSASELTEKIHSSVYELKVQCKRTDYLSQCSDRNQDVLDSLEHNEQYLAHACLVRSRQQTKTKLSNNVLKDKQ